MSHSAINITLFFFLTCALIVWGMEDNDYDKTSVHSCTGPCYEQWQLETGGVVAIAQADAAARASASPAELGKKAYIGCVACHGAQGEGGIGPALAGQAEDAIITKLQAYKAGETIGSQSALMWSQAAQLRDADIEHLAAFVATL